jgi:hypothetical protein
MRNYIDFWFSPIDVYNTDFTNYSYSLGIIRDSEETMADAIREFASTLPAPLVFRNYGPAKFYLLLNDENLIDLCDASALFLFQPDGAGPGFETGSKINVDYVKDSDYDAREKWSGGL